MVVVKFKSINIYDNYKLQVFEEKNGYNKRRTDNEVYASVPIRALDKNGWRNRRVLIKLSV